MNTPLVLTYPAAQISEEVGGDLQGDEVAGLVLSLSRVQVQALALSLSRTEVEVLI